MQAELYPLNDGHDVEESSEDGTYDYYSHLASFS